jgi:Protein of unknown function (DUF3154).
MALPIIGSLIEAGMKILDKVIPDPQAKLEAQYKLLALQQAGEFKEIDAQLQMAQGQMDINKIEAANPSVFVSGWRPAMGWCCVAIFAANYIGVPLLAWLSPMLNIPPPVRLDLSEVFPVLLGMLGLGTIRMNEKIKNVASV